MSNLIASSTIESLQLVAAFVFGVVLGVAYFGGLWWTVAALKRAANPLMLCLLSFAIRFALLLCLLFSILQFGVPALLSTLAGLITARFFLVGRVKQPLPKLLHQGVKPSE